MNTVIHALQGLFADARYAVARRLGGWAAATLLLAAIGWLAWSRGGADPGTPMGLALVAGMGAAAATAVGALPALFVRRISVRMQDVMLGFGAGVMLAASAFSLILPGVAVGSALLGSRPAGAALVALGVSLGALLLLAADRVVPHEHHSSGYHGPDWLHLRRVWLMVFAITLHNLPEGMAIGVGFAGGDKSVGIPLALAIAIQDVPEGMVVAVALRTIAYSRWRATLLGALSGLAEPLGAVLGNALTTGFAPLYPAGLGFAAGAMIWVVSHEIIPETHRKGHEQAATLGIVGGFIVMLLLDTAFG